MAKDADIEGLAWYYLGIVQAVLNLPQAGAARSALLRMVDIAMSAWPDPGQAASAGIPSPASTSG